MPGKQPPKHYKRMRRVAMNPSEDDFARFDLPRQLPHETPFEPYTRERISRWIHRMIARLEFDMLNQGKLSERTTVIQRRHWRNSLRYLKHCRKFLKWLDFMLLEPRNDFEGD